jgi:hypothetical protein
MVGVNMINKSIGKRPLFFLILFSLLLIVGCSSETPVDTEVEPTDAVPTPIVTIIPPEDNVNSEQTGEDTSGSEKGKGDLNFTLPKEGIRPYAVMIDNEGTRPLPQGGIYLAQVIYEIIVEGGTTRLMPVFWDKEPTMIGPVRSSRHYFIDYAMEHDAIYVHFGYSPKAMQDIKTYKINNINGVANGGEVFWDLTKDRNNWQDSYTSMEKVKGYVERVKYRTETDKGLAFKYSEEDYDFTAGSSALNINIKYTSSYDCSFKYDEERKLYLRYRKGNPHMERITDEQLTAKNIIIQKVSNYTIKGDDAGRQEVNNVGSGEGYFISNGKCIEIKWSKKSRTDQTKYLDTDGNEIVLNPGQTWIQITPTNGKVTFE